MGVRWKLIRAPLTILYRMMYLFVECAAGISLPYTIRLGRRVRIWHHGGIIIHARSIGDDTQIRQNTTMGIASVDRHLEIPTIGDRVDIGCGACILGGVTVGDEQDRRECRGDRRRPGGLDRRGRPGPDRPPTGPGGRPVKRRRRRGDRSERGERLRRCLASLAESGPEVEGDRLRRLGLDRRQRRAGPVDGRRGGRARHGPAVLGGQGEERGVRPAQGGRARGSARAVRRRRLRGRRRLDRSGRLELEARPEAAVVCGRRRESTPTGRSTTAWPTWSGTRPSARRLACGGDAMMRVEAFEAVGGFDPTAAAGEEPELCQRLRKAGLDRLAGRRRDDPARPGDDPVPPVVAPPVPDSATTAWTSRPGSPDERSNGCSPEGWPARGPGRSAGPSAVAGGGPRRGRWSLGSVGGLVGGGLAALVDAAPGPPAGGQGPPLGSTAPGRRWLMGP